MITPDNPGRDRNDEELNALRQHYRETISPEEIKNVTDLVLGGETRGPAKARSLKEDLGEVMAYLSLTRQTSKLVVVAVLVVACAISIPWTLSGRNIVVRTPAGWQSASGHRLPDVLRFRPGRAAAVLDGRQTPLSGTLGGVLRGGTGLTSIDATFSGRTPAGLPVTFRGTLLLTNAPGVSDVRRQVDFVGALLSGELLIGTNPPVQIEQPYLLE